MRSMRNILMWGVVLTLSFTLAGCQWPKKDDPGLSQYQGDLDAHRALWNNANFVDYQYEYRISCFCLPQENIVVVVRGGAVNQAYFTPSGVYLTAQEMTSLRTIDGLFDGIQAFIDRGQGTMKVQYNTTYGYPEVIALDPMPAAIDDESSKYITNFQ